jgi:hypothetical protein
MSNSAINQNRFSGVNSPQTPPEDLHIQLVGRVGSPSVTIKATGQPSPALDKAGIDSNPVFSSWWERWRKARTRVFPPRPSADIPKSSGATGRVSK